MTNHPNRSKRMEGWYWCRLREKNDWTICRWSGSHWYATDYALERAPQVIDSECLHEPIADDGKVTGCAATRMGYPETDEEAAEGQRQAVADLIARKTRGSGTLKDQGEG